MEALGESVDGNERLQKLSRKAGLNAAASGIDYVARTAIEFILNPVLVAGLGSTMYGVWRVLWRLTGYLWATTGRSAQALQSAVANRLHSDDTDEKRRLVGAAALVTLAYTPVLILSTVLLAVFLPGALDVPAEHLLAVRWAIILLGIDSITLSLITLPRSALQGENHGYRRMGMSAVLVVAGGLGMAIAVWLDWGIAGVALANWVNTLYTGFVFYRVTKRYVPWYAISRPTRTEIRWFFGLSGWFMLWKFVNQLMVAGDVVVLGSFASVDAVSVYSLTKFVPEAVLPLLSMLVMGGLPGLGGVIGFGDHDRARRIRAEVMSLTWLIGTATAVAIVIWNRAFVELWVGAEYFAGDTEVLLIMITLLQFGMIRNDAFIIDLTLKVRGKVLVGLTSAVIALGVSAILVGPYELGISGLCIGMITGRAMLSVLYPWMVGQAIGHPLLAQVRSALRPILVTAAMLAVAAEVGGEQLPNSWMPLILGSAITGLLALVVAMYAGLRPAERATLVRRMQTIAGRLT